MSISLYSISVETFLTRLKVLSSVLDKGAGFAREKNWPDSELVDARLAPDMFPLARQVQIACDQAKRAAALLAGQEAPVYEDTEKSIDELKARIAKTIAYIKSLPEAPFAGAETRHVTVPLGKDRELVVTGFDLIMDWTLPNLYFHVTTAYDILRHKGVPVGKQDFLNNIGDRIRQKN